jgi:predicted ATPase/class 3 adenylate cyclase
VDDDTGVDPRPLPVGTVTFLRTDVEGSMQLARSLGARWDEINAEHLGIIRRAVDARGGVCVRTEGDAFFGAFQEAGAAVLAAVDAQWALARHAWPDGATVRVRMGLHTGEAHRAGDDYGGFEVNRAARIAAAGHGGQVVMSEPTRLLAESSFPEGVVALDLGRHVLRSVPAPERLHQLDIPGLRHDFPPLRTSRPGEGNLPTRLTSFIGRDEDLDALDALLEANRLVTLTGPGGVGKTSLAIELGRRWLDRVQDGAWFVALDTIRDPTVVRSEIARTLGLFDGPDRPAADGLDRYLADRTTILILDNFEQLMDGAAQVASILRGAPGTRIVVTSRAPLRIAGEQEVQVRTLAGTDAGVTLFAQRARAVRPGWEPGPERPVIEEIAGLLDGLPLGIELAAARVGMLPLTAIRDRLAARLPLPGAGPRDVPDRQRTLELAIAWSHDLLEPGQQQLFEELGVFEGGFDVDQAAAVHAADVLDGLATLVEQSLIARDVAADPAAVRFRLLGTIRMFALDRLRDRGREADVRRRHATAFLALAEEAAAQLPGRDQPRWLRRLALDHDNLRAAVQWSIDGGETDLALGLVGNLWRYWHLDGHLVEARAMADGALAMPGADTPSPQLLGAVTAAGGIAYWDGRPGDAFALYRRQRELARALGDERAEADALFNLSYERFVADDPSGAQTMIEDAIARFRALGDERGAARAIWGRGTVQLQVGDADGSERILTEILGTFERLGDAWFHALTLGSIAWTHYARGNLHEAGWWLVRGFQASHALQDVASTVIQLPATAIMALEADRPDDAAALLGAAEALGLRYGVHRPGGLERLIARGNPEARVLAAIGQERVDAAKALGRRMTLDEAAALVGRIADEHYRPQ